MTRTQYNLLVYIRDRGPVSSIDVLNHFQGDVKLNVATAFLNRSIDEGILEPSPRHAKCPDATLKITPEGLIAIEQYEDERRKQRIAYGMAMAGAAISGVIGTLITLLLVR